MIVKTCGLQTIDAASTAIYHGADLVGAIFVPNRARTIDLEVARAIAIKVRAKREESHSNFQKAEFFHSLLNGNDTTSSEYYDRVEKELKAHAPFFVGVFRNQSIEDILTIVETTGIDIVQLHGSENKLEYVNSLQKVGIPVISRYLMSDLTNEEKFKNEILISNKHLLVLLDSDNGGEGETLNWQSIGKLNEQRKGVAKYLLAGGLDPGNVQQATTVNGVIGVDVSSGIESNKQKDHEKIKKFIKNANLHK